ncbi:hypothetical protein Gotur_006155 [Gossypium turneri]
MPMMELAFINHFWTALLS